MFVICENDDATRILSRSLSLPRSPNYFQLSRLRHSEQFVKLWAYANFATETTLFKRDKTSIIDIIFPFYILILSRTRVLM